MYKIAGLLVASLVMLVTAAASSSRADDVGPDSPSFIMPAVPGVTIAGPGGFAHDGSFITVWRSHSPLNICVTVTTGPILASAGVKLMPSGMTATTEAKKGVSQSLCAAGQTSVLVTGGGAYRVDKY